MQSHTNCTAHTIIIITSYYTYGHVAVVTRIRALTSVNLIMEIIQARTYVQQICLVVNVVTPIHMYSTYVQYVCTIRTNVHISISSIHMYSTYVQYVCTVRTNVHISISSIHMYSTYVQYVCTVRTNVHISISPINDDHQVFIRVTHTRFCIQMKKINGWKLPDVY